MLAPSAPSISVIIATYARGELLAECLAHLARQPFQSGDEVLVVDNGSPEETARAVQRSQASFPVPLWLMHEPRAGKTHALARALSAARGDVFAFLDDDVNVDARWLAVVREAMRDETIGLMGGRIVPRWEAGVPGWVRSLPAEHARLGAPLGLLDYPPDVVDLGPRTALGSNMAARREAVEAVGGFSLELGKLRGTLLSGEDHDFCLRVQQAGFRAVYVPEAVVHHWVPASRARVSYFLQWFYWSGITNAVLDARSGRTGAKAYRMSAYLARSAATAAAASLAQLLAGRRAAALNRALDVAFAIGYLREQALWPPRAATHAPAAREAA